MGVPGLLHLYSLDNQAEATPFRSCISFELVHFVGGSLFRHTQIGCLASVTSTARVSRLDQRSAIFSGGHSCLGMGDWQAFAPQLDSQLQNSKWFAGCRPSQNSVL